MRKQIAAPTNRAAVAAFILPSVGRRSRPRRLHANLPKCDQTKRTGAADLCQKIPDEPAIGKNSFKHRALAPAGSLARRAALRTALQARPFPRTGASLLTGLGPHSLRSEPRP